MNKQALKTSAIKQAATALLEAKVAMLNAASVVAADPDAGADASYFEADARAVFHQADVLLTRLWGHRYPAVARQWASDVVEIAHGDRR